MRASRQAFRSSRRVRTVGLCRFSSLRAPRTKSPPPQAVAAAQGRLRRCRSSPMHPASPSSRRLASDPAALATPPTPFFSSLLVVQESAGLEDRTMPDAVGRSRDLGLHLTESQLDGFLPSPAAFGVRARFLQSRGFSYEVVRSALGLSSADTE